MSKRLFLMLILLIIALPSTLYAVGMGNYGGMGGIGAMVNKINIQTRTVGTVVFSHNIHGTKCNACHPKLFKKKSNSNHVSMKVMERGKSCGACHNGRKAFNVTGDCAKCHAGDIVFKDKSIGNVTFPHSVHIEMLEGCDSCHPDLYKAQRGTNKATMEAMENGESCGACHDGSDAFGVAVTSDCVRCHAGDITFKNKNIGNITFPHSVHIEMLEGCDSCHPDPFKAKQGANKATMKAMENGESCGACHDGSDAFGVASTGDCTRCHAGDIIFKDDGLGDVTFPHSVHIEMLDGCDSCHPDLIEPKRGANNATMKDMENSKSCGACHNGSDAFGVTEDCESCHEGGVTVDKINIQTPTVGTVVFSHNSHASKCNRCHPKLNIKKNNSSHVEEIVYHGSSCNKCHPKPVIKKNNSNHVSMKVMESGKSCGICHNGKHAFSVAANCAKCHAGDILFKDEDAGDVTFPHSVHIEMFEGCDSCHPDLYKAMRGANKATMEDMENGESCGACHDGSGAFGVAEDCESCHDM